MPALHGEEGARGRPASLESLDLTKFRVRGNGTFRMKTSDKAATQLVWESRPSESMSLRRANERDHELAAEMSKRYGLKPGQAAPQKTPPRPTGPVQFIAKLVDFWKLEPPDAVRLLGFNVAETDHVAAVLDGRDKFRGRDVMDRIAYLVSIRATLHALFRDLDVENDWLREPHEMLDRQTPMSLLLGGSMEDLLLIREYVDTVAGR